MNQPDKSTADALSALRGQFGSAFAAAYIQVQRDSHQKVLDLLRGYTIPGEVASLKDFATEMAPIVEGHIKRAESLAQ